MWVLGHGNKEKGVEILVWTELCRKTDFLQQDTAVPQDTGWPCSALVMCVFVQESQDTAVPQARAGRVLGNF